MFLFSIDVRQNLVNHLTVFDTRNDPHGTLAMPTNRDVNIEHPVRRIAQLIFP